jgi:hypothetical protein
MTFEVYGIVVSKLLYLIFQQIGPVSISLQRPLYTKLCHAVFVKFAIIRMKLLLK